MAEACKVYVVAVGFRLDRAKAVGYRRCGNIEELLEAVKWLIQKRRAQIISIRLVEEVKT